MTWNVAGLDPSRGARVRVIEKAAEIRELAGHHGIVCLQELTGSEPASELEHLLQSQLHAGGGQHATRAFCNHECDCHWCHRVAVVVNLQQLGLAAGSVSPVRVGKGWLEGAMPTFLGDGSTDCPKFVGAKLKLGARVLVAGSVYRPPRHGLELRRQFHYLELLVGKLRKEHPGALFLLGGDFNLKMPWLTGPAPGPLQRLAEASGMRVIPAAAPTTSSHRLDYFLASEGLTVPGSQCSIVREGGGGRMSDHWPVEVIARIS